MSDSGTLERARRQRPAPRRVEVRRVEDLTPHMRRVTFGGDGLRTFTPGVPTAHVKVFLPGPGDTEPALPEPGPGGPDFPEGRPRPVVRTYTPRRFDPERVELQIDFVLHDAGPASRWAQEVGVGDRAAVAGPGRRGYEPDPAADWFLLAGDETALPAIAMILEALPVAEAAAPVTVLVEVDGPADEQSLPGGQETTVRWVHRGDAAPGARLEEAVRAATIPGGDGRAWVAGEARVIRRIRRHLLEERGMPKSSVVTRGYWRRGEADHPDHDDGDG